MDQRRAQSPGILDCLCDRDGVGVRGIERTPLEEAEAGDIVAIAGLTKGTVADTFCDPSVETPLVAQPIDPPTVSMSFIVNNSPLAGTEGDKVTGRMIRDRLLREAEGNVALRVTESEERDSMEVAGRGELQLGILIETMRREGFELSVSRPKVLLTRAPNGALLEPIEEAPVLAQEAGLGHCSLHRPLQAHHLHLPLRHVVEDAVVQALDHHLHVAVAGEEDSLELGGPAPELVEEDEAVRAGEAEVQDRRVHARLRLGKGFVGAREPRDDEPSLGQYVTDQTGKRLVVVYEQHATGAFRHGLTKTWYQLVPDASSGRHHRHCASGTGLARRPADARRGPAEPLAAEAAW
jgi:hypothetical protein